MTTILADARLGIMVADSNISDGTTAASMRKVWRVGGALVGIAGDVCEFNTFLNWYREGMSGPVSGINCIYALVLSSSGLVHFAGKWATPSQRGFEAIGTGAMAALATHEALDFQDPKRAVRIVCKHDATSRGPVRAYELNPRRKAIA